jgi:hypothetical protein
MTIKKSLNVQDSKTGATVKVLPPTGKSAVYVNPDGTGITSNEDGDVIQHDDLRSALELSGWTYTGRPTKQ